MLCFELDKADRRSDTKDKKKMAGKRRYSPVKYNNFESRREEAQTSIDKYLSSGECRLIIDNLHPGVIGEDLLFLFSTFGPVKKAIVFHDDSGTSLGSGEVVFSFVMDAFKAMKAFKGIVFCGLPIKVSCAGRTQPGKSSNIKSRLSLPFTLTKECLDEDIDEYMKKRRKTK